MDESFSTDEKLTEKKAAIIDHYKFLERKLADTYY